MVTRRNRGKKEEEGAPAEYSPDRSSFKPGDKIRCAGCDAEYTLSDYQYQDGELNWGFQPICQVSLAKGAPVSAWVCKTGNFGPSLRCYNRALKRMTRCPGCGLGPRDPDPEDPDEEVTRYHNAGEIPHGSICSRCERAVAAGYAVLAEREDVTWRSFDTRALFELADYDEEGQVPEEALEALREAAYLIAQIAAAPDHLAAKTFYEARRSGSSRDVPTIPAEIERHSSSEEPMGEVGEATAALVERIGEAIGRAISLAQADSRRQGSSILKALIRSNSTPDPYGVLVREEEAEG